MIEVLDKNPNQFFEFDDDEEAKGLLLELGLIDKFANQRPQEQASTQIVNAETRTHYIIATLFLGNPVPTDNGYLIYAAPKSQFSLARMGEFMRRLLAAYQENGQRVAGSSYFSGTSLEN
jgi:hypothetical protein